MKVEISTSELINLHSNSIENSKLNIPDRVKNLYQELSDSKILTYIDEKIKSKNKFPKSFVNVVIIIRTI